MVLVMELDNGIWDVQGINVCHCLDKGMAGHARGSFVPIVLQHSQQARKRESGV